MTAEARRSQGIRLEVDGAPAIAVDRTGPSAQLAMFERRRNESERATSPRPPREFTARGRAEILCDSGSFVEALPEVRQHVSRYGGEDSAAVAGAESSSAAFDIRGVLDAIFDRGLGVEVMARFGASVLTGFARLAGMPVGVVASQPKRRGGILDSASAVKIAKLVDFCGRFGLPVVTFADVPGFMPGSAEERRGVIDHGAKILAAYARAGVPKLTVIVRKAYGGAYIAMGSRSLGAQFGWAWPSAELAVMGSEAAVGILHRRELAQADSPMELRQSLATAYREAVTPPYFAADVGIIDEVIAPAETRQRMIDALRFLLRRSRRLEPTDPWATEPVSG
jgi:acetyl-CoA carboxylase carboxyltransferase component